MKSKLFAIALATLCISTSADATERAALLIGYSDENKIDNFQEDAAVKIFKELQPDGAIISTDDVSSLTKKNYDVVWVHIDRCGIGINNLPAAFSNPTVLNTLDTYLQEGGNLYLSKQATQILHKIGRIPTLYAPGIYGDGNGGEGTDVWTVNAQIGHWFIDEARNPNDLKPDEYYDHRSHPIYNNMAVNNDYNCETYGLLGTGNGSAMWREDHNCLWDLNAYSNIYTADGRNTVEKFQNQNDCVVLGTWGHVVDHAVAGIVEFNPSGKYKGYAIANGLAAYELSPRQGGNSQTANIKALTGNTINYLATKNPSSVDDMTDIATSDMPVEYYNIQGVKVAADNLIPGIYIRRQGNNTDKIIVK
jgi:hypothetical protein